MIRMKAKMVFKLPEEREEYELHLNAGRLYAAIYDYALWLKTVCESGAGSSQTAADCRKKLQECMQENEFYI